MIFHTPDTTQQRLASCFKRALTNLKQPGDALASNHPLAVMWANATMMMDAKTEFKAKPKNEKLVKQLIKLKGNELAYDLVVLDWVALKIDAFSKTNLIAQDPGCRALLHDWKTRLFICPIPALNWYKEFAKRSNN